MNRDELVLIALDLNLPDILNLCLSNSNYNRYICNNNSFWQKKIYKDFGITTTSRTAKKDYRKYLEFRDDMFTTSIGGIPNGYDSLYSKYKQIFNQEFRKVFNNDNPYKHIGPFVSKFIAEFHDNQTYYFAGMNELILEITD